ncbi:MAG: ABC transporter substrate-binding protein [Xanthobacteraceae bacterium]
MCTVERTIGRRAFMGLVGSLAAWPLTARAQPAGPPVVGYLSGAQAGIAPHLLDAIRQGLKDVGFVEGQNLTIEYRYADNQFDRLPALAAELVARPVAAIVANGNLSALAAKNATSAIPIVFNTAGEPVAVGLVTGLNRPGGNITGFGFFSGALAAKRLGFLREVVPKVPTVAVLLDRNSPFNASQRRETQDAARTLGVKLLLLPAGTERDIDTAFATMEKQKVGALLVSASPYFTWNRRSQILELAARSAIPAIYPLQEWVTSGGLMSYGPDLTETYRLVGIYTGKILKGVRPDDLPVENSSRFEFAINIATAKALKLEISPRLIALADEVVG